MDGFAAVDFSFAREALQRGIAVLYLVAFISTLNQFRALLGEHGLLPAPELLAWAGSSARRRRMLRPTLFVRIRYTDRRLVALCVAGIVLSLALVAGLPQLGPPWVPMVCFLMLWLGYMSISSIGQTFYGFGWEMLLLEAGFLAAFLGSATQPPPTVIIVLFWWLVIRLEFGAGMIKIRGGREWRDLTALMYHHETQPMPGPLSRQAHLLPRWFHRLEVVGNHVAQLAAPWLLLAPILGLWIPGAVRGVATDSASWPAIVGAVGAGMVIATQLWLVVTGNFAWLNWATIVLACSAIGIGSGHPRRAVTDLPWLVDDLPLPWLVVTTLVGVLYLVLSWPAVRNLCSRDQAMNASFNRWQLANAYGAFGTVTKERIEIVIEGTLHAGRNRGADPGPHPRANSGADPRAHPGSDPDPATAEWREYGFKGKPGDLRRTPALFAPYHLRLDWLMWFLPLGRIYEDWFAMLLVRLLEADPPTLRLLRHDPFGGERPRQVRAVAYRYRFSTRVEHRETGAVWVRDRRRVVVRPLSLDAE